MCNSCPALSYLLYFVNKGISAKFVVIVKITVNPHIECLRVIGKLWGNFFLKIVTCVGCEKFTKYIIMSGNEKIDFAWFPTSHWTRT